MPLPDEPAPVIVAWGAGVDSTAMIIELAERGERIDMVLRARMPERPETLAFIPTFEHWMDERGIPHETVGYTPKRFKHWPPYSDLLENCLTNGTLPSIAFGRGVCSLKWKVAPQDAWTKAWPPAQHAWARGQKVIRLIGYDCSPRDSQRYAHREGHVSDLFEYRYPLREWGRTREDCERRIAAAGLPPVVASSCWFCTGMTCDEVRTLPAEHLRLIVLMEARAKPRLRTCEGLWRSSTKGLRGREARPGSMTQFIRDQGLLPAREVDRIVAEAPTELVAFLDGAAGLPLEKRPAMWRWIERFNAGVEKLAA
ncbi:hypothetical protein GCM10007897_24280 [Sphingobium jiangsuense]|uniref:Phosphoadenosine phosphosulphate reductase domain-containing protein n=1 Tax=Sphingobium jiangsuense TaxID=870476 RepID=A0A7W6BRR5_9SPHN|nr:hypothetical protein [Sphingobium jiangsuense]MBB3928597.1 hypothetical protein [Sphingobium jiangsuense]GLT01037.1 hypothetical protein GCM10007897_24280 [Sphingobium jiangsuense]